MKGLESDDKVNGFLGYEWAKKKENGRKNDYLNVYPSLDEIILGLCDE